MAGTRRAPRILLVNDDGADAPGLGVLAGIAAQLSNDIWTVAPETDQSGTSHSISLHEPLRIRERGDRRYSVSGTPSDCVLLAVGHLLCDHLPDLVISGVNCGANLSDSVAYSGTVGAAMTALMLDIPAVALSQAFRTRDQVRWDTAAAMAPVLLRPLLDAGWGHGVGLNINFPDLPSADVAGISFCRPGRGSIRGVRIEARQDTRDQPYYWIGFERSPERVRAPDTDVAAVRAGRIAISPLRFEREINGEWGDLEAELEEALKQHLGSAGLRGS